MMPRVTRRDAILGAGAATVGAAVPAIFGGRELLPEDYPYALRLDTAYGAQMGRCGATHVGGGWCVSAAHCGVDDGVTGFRIGGRPVRKVDGRYFVLAPKSYERAGLQDDFLYIFDPELIGAPHIDILTRSQFAELRAAAAQGGERALSVGYGTTRLDSAGRPTDVSDALKGIDVEILKADRRSIEVFDPERQGGVCVGDSGSGLLWRDRIAGVTSSVSFNPTTGWYCDTPGWSATYKSLEMERDTIETLMAASQQLLDV